MNQSVVLFDGVCNLCNASINFIIDHDKQNHFKFGALQSEEAQKLLSNYAIDAKYLDSIVLIENDKYFVKSAAALKIASRLDAGMPLFYYLFSWWPRFIRDFLYDSIAKNRYKWFGKSESCRMPTPELKGRFLES